MGHVLEDGLGVGFVPERIQAYIVELSEVVAQSFGVGETIFSATANGSRVEIQVSQGMGPDLTLGGHDPPAPLPFAEPFTVAYPPAVRKGQAGDVGLHAETAFPP